MGRHAAVFLALVLAVVATACGGDDDGADRADDPAGEVDASTAEGDSGTDAALEACRAETPPEPAELEIGVVAELPDEGNDHVFCPSYLHRPPASGDHFDAWQNCGFYTEPVQDQTAVHALEHGAVWIAYAPDLTADEVAAIEARVSGEEHLLASPYPGLKNAIVLTAWTRQLALDRVGDPLFEEFIDDHLARRSPTAPEAGASCGGAIGVAPDDPDAGFAAILDQVLG
jgi:hypothetical protein